MNRELLREELIRDEGLRLHAYRDSVGLLTIGVGHLLPAAAVGVDDITHERAMELLEGDIDTAFMLAVDVFGVLSGMDDARQRALVNMSFNLGQRIRTFEHFIKYVRGGRWVLAAAEGKDSKWAHQVGERAERLMLMIRDGGE